MATATYDAFLIFNTRDVADARMVADGLGARGVRPYFSDRDLDPGDDWSAVEEAAFKEAPSAVVLLGKAGWGPSHRRLADRAVDADKRVIPVALPGASHEAMAERGAIFLRLQRIEFPASDDSAALDQLAHALRVSAEPRRRANATRILSILIDGGDDERSDVIQELGATAARLRAGRPGPRRKEEGGGAEGDAARERAERAARQGNERDAAAERRRGTGA